MQPLRRSVAVRSRTLWIALVVVAAAGRPAYAVIRFDADPAPIDVSRRSIELGSGFDTRLREARGEPGSCVQDIGTERADAAATHYSIATLSHVGGRLVIGVHVGKQVAIESLASPHMTDAARRLANSDPGAFRDLCGDGFVAARALGGQWFAELAVQGTDAVRAARRLEAGTWSDPAQFREVLDRLAASGGVSAREIPKGNRSGARALTMTDVIEQAIAFPASIPDDATTPYYAIFAPYSEPALSGMPLPGAGEIDARELAQLAFRDEGPSERSSAAFRAAEMRKAVVHRERQDFRAVAGEASSLAAAADPQAFAPREGEIDERSVREAVTAPAAVQEIGVESAGARPAVQKMAALVYADPDLPPVYATTTVPTGLYAERVRQRSYWVPGAAQPSAAVRAAIEKAKAATPTSGTTVIVFEQAGTPPVVLTDAAPVEGTFSAPAGEGHAWIAGVATPDTAQRAAIDAAIAVAP